MSNELGGGNGEGARQATLVALKLTAVLAVCVVSALGFGHNLWAASFTDSPLVFNAFASMLPLLLTSVLCDFLQGILSGLARGCGWQYLVVFINIGSFYFIGMPIATILGFHFKFYAKVNHASPSSHSHTACNVIDCCLENVGAGIMDWVNLWFGSPNGGSIGAFENHKMDSNRLVSKSISQD